MLSNLQKFATQHGQCTLNTATPLTYGAFNLSSAQLPPHGPFPQPFSMLPLFIQDFLRFPGWVPSLV